MQKPSQKTPLHKTNPVEKSPFAGPDGAALVPPPYGIDFIDQAPEQGVAPIIQRKADLSTAGDDSRPRPHNHTGLPDRLKSGVEGLSGLSLDDVRVHYNSSKPAGVQALAYTQAAEIHVGPGQERHLPHEAWHVVQQKQGRVKPTGSISGLPLNDNQALEGEADQMGTKALQTHARAVTPKEIGTNSVFQKKSAVQRDPGFLDNRSRLNTATRLGAQAVHPIQRAIGFEFELGSVRTYKALPKDVKQPLPKGSQIAPSYKGIKVTADDAPTGSKSNLSDLELIIDPPIDDTQPTAGRIAMKKALENLQELTELLARLAPPLRPTSAKATGGAADIFIHPTEDGSYESGQLQATAGLSLTALTQIRSGKARESVTGKAGKPHASQAVIWEDFVSRGGAGGDNKPLWDLCRQKVVNVKLKYSTLTDDEKDHLASVMSLIVQIPILARTNEKLPYPKSAAGSLMARTDFGSIISIMPSKVLMAISESNFDIILLSVINEFLALPLALTLADLVFPLAFTTKEIEPVRITLGEWFFGLQQAIPIDRLTTNRYSRSSTRQERQEMDVSEFLKRHEKEAESLESLGSYGSKMDADINGARTRPIFEFRTLAMTLTGNLVPTGLAVWDYVTRAEKAE